MKNILLIGGMASGKTTLVEALMKADPSINDINMSNYAVKIPMTLISKDHPDLMSYPKNIYIDTILKNQTVDEDLFRYKRREMDEFCQKVRDVYGETILAELGFLASDIHKQNVIDNIAKVPSVKYLKDQGFYVVGLECSFEDQIQRRLENPKSIDHPSRYKLEEQIMRTNAFFEIRDTTKLADKVYDTRKIRSDSSQVVQEILRDARL